MKSLALLILLSVPFSSASCAFKTAARCKNDAGPVSGDYARTVQICNDVQSVTCYCVKASEDYCIVDTNDQYEDFKDECESEYGWRFTTC